MANGTDFLKRAVAEAVSSPFSFPSSGTERIKEGLALCRNLALRTPVTMLLKFCCLLSLSLLPLSALAQGGGHQVRTERELLAALCAPQQDQHSRDVLLKANLNLVTANLWNDLNGLAVAAYYNQSSERSLAFYEVAIQVASQLNDPKLIATTYYNIGRTHSGLNHLPQAVEAYLNSKKYFERAGLQRDCIYILSDLGTLYLRLEDYQKAKDCSEQSIKLADQLKASNVPAGDWPDGYGVAGDFSTLAELSLREGDYAQAIEFLQKSLSLYQQLNASGNSYDIYIADDYAGLGRVYTSAGDYSRGLLNLNKSLDILKKLSDSDRVAGVLNSLGFLYMEQEDYEQAAAHYNLCLQTYLAEQNRMEAARVLLNLGVVELRQEHYDTALEYFKRSLQEATAVSNKEVMIAASEGIGVVLKARGEYAKALETLNRSLSIAREVSDQTRQAELQWRLSEVYYSMGDGAQAEEFAERAAKLARDLRLPKLTYLATTALGEGYALQNKDKIATETMIQATQQIESMREQVAGQAEEVQLFFENKVETYQSMVDLLVRQNKPTDALLYAERAKGRVLLDVLRDGRVDMSARLTPAEREEGRRLNRAIVELNERIRAEQTKTSPDASLLKRLYSDLDAARLNYESFQNTLYVSHPDLNIRRGEAPELNSESLSNLTQDNKTAYLEYVVTREQVFLFALTKKDANTKPELRAYLIRVKADDLTRKVNQFHRLISERNPVFTSSAHELYDLLVKPAAQQLAGVNTICIIPDSSLWDVPFQALLSGSDRYLLEDYALYYAPSLSVLQAMTRHKGADTRQARGSLIAFGNPVIGRISGSKSQVSNSDQDLCPLPEAETEVTALAQIYGSADSKAFIGGDASERTFKQLATGYRILHLATHGVLDNRHPLYSYLLLTKSEGDVENDGLLEAREIMDMNLHADLAVLSACETARGRVGAGEGVIGMSWAFFVAGVRTTVVSQWKVNSASTSQLMVNFYKALKAGNAQDAGTKVMALRSAAISLLSDQRFRHPFYWAGFVVVGSNE
jgi:CHAT domain-containing protein